MTTAIFDSATRPQGDLAGVFEHEDGAGYFYLYDLSKGEGQKIVGAIRVATGDPAYSDGDVAIRWGDKGNAVGLFIKGQLWAAFESATRQKFGGGYSPDKAPPQFPGPVLAAFA